MKIEILGIEKLRPFVANARTHSEWQIEQICASIREFGFTNPVLIDGNDGIIAGHGRVMAAGKMGMENVPCIRLGHLSEAQRRAYVIADNKLALNAGWDETLLAAELAALKEMDFDLGLVGFTDEELANLFAELNDGNTDPDAVPEPPDEPVSVRGDVWVMGRHRIVCGDCTDADTVEKCLGGDVPHLMVTDPPYGVEYDPNWRNERVMVKGEKKGEHGSKATGKVMNDDRADWRAAWALFPGDVAYVWHASGENQGIVMDSLKACGFEIRNHIIWAKNHLVIGRGNYHHQYEPCWYAVKRKAKDRWNGGRKKTTLWRNIDDVIRPDEGVFLRRIDAETLEAISGDCSTVWDIKKPEKSETGHSTQKPVECMKRPMLNNSLPGDAIYEPFSGSGTSIIAAEMSGRRCLAIELNPAYVDIAILRWQDFTGLKAVHGITGKPFDDSQS